MDQMTYDRLLYWNTKKAKVEPYLATSWTATPSKIVLKLRTGATCADGTPVTATVVANSLRYDAAPSTNSIFRPQTFGPGKATITGNNATRTVTIRLSKPFSPLLEALAVPASSIICPSALANPGSMKARPGGSGPYTLVSSSRGNTYKLVARKGYNWGPKGWSTSDAGVPDTIVEKVIENNTTMANALLTHQIDIGPVVGVDRSRVASNKSFRQIPVPDTGGTGIVFNETAGLPGASPQVRKAIMLAISGPDFMQAWTFGAYEHIQTMLTPNMACYNSALGKFATGYNPAQAKQLLAQAGWKPGPSGKLTKNGKPLVVRIAGWTQQNAGPEYMLNALEKIGITTRLTNLNTSGWVNQLFNTRKYDVTAYWYPSPQPSPYIMPAQDLGIGIKDPQYYAASNRAAAAPAAKACRLWDTALKLELKHVKPIGALATTWFSNGYEFGPFWPNLDLFTLHKA